jgi:DNA-binding GntR family transcriptional regulator
VRTTGREVSREQPLSIELADRLGLSRPTMRRAMQELARKGQLVRKRGGNARRA